MTTQSAASYKIGDATVRRFTETVLTTLPSSFLYPELDEAGLDDYERWLLLGKPEESRNAVHLSVHSWLVEVEGRIVLIDTGIGNGKDRPFSKLFHQLQTPFLEQLEAAGFACEKVDTVLSTHLHVDHVGWNTRLAGGRWVPTFPNATYVFPEVERDFFSTPAAANRRVVFEDSVLPVIDAGQAETIGAEGGKYLDIFSFYPTPGHSAGHMSISLSSGDEEALFSGDVMHNPIQVHRPDLGSVFCADPSLARSSRRWLLDYAAERGPTVFTAHFPETSAGKVAREGERFVWRYV